MSILTRNNTPTTPSDTELLDRIKQHVEMLSSLTFEKLLNTQKQGIRVVWEDRKFTPQEIIDHLGTDALKIFQFHGALTEFIKTLAAIENLDVDLAYPKNAFTVTNGKITVTEDPYQP